MQKTKNSAIKHQQTAPAFDMSKTTSIKCDAIVEGSSPEQEVECGGELFMPAVKFRRLSRVITGQPEDTIIPVQVFACMSCGSVPEQFDVQ